MGFCSVAPRSTNWRRVCMEIGNTHSWNFLHYLLISVISFMLQLHIDVRTRSCYCQAHTKPIKGWPWSGIPFLLHRTQKVWVCTEKVFSWRKRTYNWHWFHWKFPCHCCQGTSLCFINLVCSPLCFSKWQFPFSFFFNTGRFKENSSHMDECFFGHEKGSWSGQSVWLGAWDVYSNYLWIKYNVCPSYWKI